MNKKQKLFFIFLIVIALILGVITVSLTIKNKELKDENNYKKEDVELLWASYDMHVENIKNNLDEIATIPVDGEVPENDELYEKYWQVLKDFDIEDDEYERELNSLLVDIKSCYMEYIRYGDNFASSNPILNYRETTNIKKKDLEKLRVEMHQEYEELGAFEKYLRRNNNAVVSKDSKTMENYYNKMNRIFTIRKSDLFEYVDGKHTYKKKNLTFMELLSYKNQEVAIVDELSTWLKSEYYRLKNNKGI